MWESEIHQEILEIYFTPFSFDILFAKTFDIFLKEKHLPDDSIQFAENSLFSKKVNRPP